MGHITLTDGADVTDVLLIMSTADLHSWSVRLDQSPRAGLTVSLEPCEGGPIIADFVPAFVLRDHLASLPNLSSIAAADWLRKRLEAEGEAEPLPQQTGTGWDCGHDSCAQRITCLYS